MFLFFQIEILKQKNSSNRLVRKVVSLVQGNRILVKLKNPSSENMNLKSPLQRPKLSFLSVQNY
jgi:hypothetical protein